MNWDVICLESNHKMVLPYLNSSLYSDCCIFFCLVKQVFLLQDNLDLPGKRSKAYRDAMARRRAEWTKFLEDYIASTDSLIQRCRRDTIRCPECRDSIVKEGFMEHRTHRGCQKLDPKLNLANWDVENFYDI